MSNGEGKPNVKAPIRLPSPDAKQIGLDIGHSFGIRGFNIWYCRAEGAPIVREGVLVPGEESRAIYTFCVTSQCLMGRRIPLKRDGRVAFLL